MPSHSDCVLVTLSTAKVDSITIINAPFLRNGGGGVHRSDGPRHPPHRWARRYCNNIFKKIHRKTGSRIACALHKNNKKGQPNHAVPPVSSWYLMHRFLFLFFYYYWNVYTAVDLHNGLVYFWYHSKIRIFPPHFPPIDTQEMSWLF